NAPGYYPQPSGYTLPGYNNATPGYSTQPYGFTLPGYDRGYINAAVASGNQANNVATNGPGNNLDKSRAYIHVKVPANAQVLFDDTPMTQTGPARIFMTPVLAKDKNYSFQITARWTEDGKERQQVRTVPIVPGQTAQVDFLTPENNDNNPA